MELPLFDWRLIERLRLVSLRRRKLVLRNTLVLAGCVVASAAQAAILWNNGPFVTHPGAGFGGADESRLQTTSLAMNTLGVGLGQATNVWVADDFTVGAGESWTIDAMVAYGYQTNGLTTQVLGDMRVAIYDANPSSGTANLLHGDLTTNRMASSAWTNSYRVTETTSGNTQRAVMSATSNLGWQLGPGTYWVAWSLNGTFNPAGAVFCPPVTITGQGGKPGANAVQSTTGGTVGSFTTAVVDSGNLQAQDMPFEFRGSVVPEPGSLLAIGAGLAFLGIRRRK